MLTRSRSIAAPEAAGELARMERVNDSPRPTTTADTVPKPDLTQSCKYLEKKSSGRPKFAVAGDSKSSSFDVYSKTFVTCVNGDSHWTYWVLASSDAPAYWASKKYKR